MRLHAPGSAQTGMEYGIKLGEVNRSLDELYEKGTARDGLIQGLYNAITMEPTGKLPIPTDITELSLEEFQQFRSKVEPLSDDEIHEEIRKADEENKRKLEEIHKKRGGGWPPPGSLAIP